MSFFIHETDWTRTEVRKTGTKHDLNRDWTKAIHSHWISPRLNILFLEVCNSTPDPQTVPPQPGPGPSRSPHWPSWGLTWPPLRNNGRTLCPSVSLSGLLCPTFRLKTSPVSSPITNHNWMNSIKFCLKFQHETETDSETNKLRKKAVKVFVFFVRVPVEQKPSRLKTVTISRLLDSDSPTNLWQKPQQYLKTQPFSF